MRAHARAVVDAAQAVFAAFYDVDDVPDPADYPYGVLTVDQGRDTGLRVVGGKSSEQAWRVVVLGVGSTADEARIVLEKAATAFAGTRFQITGFKTTPCRLESSGAPVGRDGELRTDEGSPVYTGSTVWTFGSTLSGA